MNLFVYGTLLVPEIWEAVTGLPDLTCHPATLEGHVIRRVRGAAYPGIHAAPGAVDPVPGNVHLDVSGEALRRLDAYEDRFYVREEVFPVVPGIGTVAAQTYLVPPDHAAAILSEEPWSLEWFEANELDRFRRRVFESRTYFSAANSRQSPSNT